MLLRLSEQFRSFKHVSKGEGMLFYILYRAQLYPASGSDFSAVAFENSLRNHKPCNNVTSCCTADQPTNINSQRNTLAHKGGGDVKERVKRVMGATLTHSLAKNIDM